MQVFPYTRSALGWGRGRVRVAIEDHRTDTGRLEGTSGTKELWLAFVMSYLCTKMYKQPFRKKSMENDPDIPGGFCPPQRREYLANSSSRQQWGKGSIWSSNRKFDFEKMQREYQHWALLKGFSRRPLQLLLTKVIEWWVDHATGKARQKPWK